MKSLSLYRSASVGVGIFHQFYPHAAGAPFAAAVVGRRIDATSGIKSAHAAGHADAASTRRYNRRTVEKSRTVAKLRLAHRNEE